ncbi:MAG: hypothetical protein AAFQ68_09345 [Bacteroidota bacterium]
MPDKDRQFGQNEQQDWAITLSEDQPGSYQRFLEQYPESQFLDEALQRLDDWEEQDAFHQALQMDDLERYNEFVLTYPKSSFATQVHERIHQLEKELAQRYKLLADEIVAWQAAERDHSFFSYRNFLRSYPGGKFEEMARERIKVLELRREEQKAYHQPEKFIPSKLDRIRLADSTYIFENENPRKQKIALQLALLWFFASSVLAGLAYIIADFIFPLSLLLSIGVGLFLLLQRDLYLNREETLVYVVGEIIASFFLIQISVLLLGGSVLWASIGGLLLSLVFGFFLWYFVSRAIQGE